MLSLEASDATSLILARLDLLCRATELSMELEVIALLKSALQAGEGTQALDDASLAVRSEAASEELAQLPVKFADVDQRLLEAWDRLKEVSPRPRP